MGNSRNPDSSYSSFGQISDPGSVTGSVPIHESTAGAIGGALGGLAKIAEVGIKYRDQSREDRIGGAVEDALNEQVKQFEGQPKLLGESSSEADPSVAAGFTPQQSAELDKLRQASAQGRPNFSQAAFFSKTSAIVQDAIHNNPRYAEAIRKRAQEVLGLNPTASAVALQIEDQKSVEKLNQMAIQEDIKAGQERGILVTNNDGSIMIPESRIVVKKALEAEAVAKTHTLLLDDWIKQKTLQGTPPTLAEKTHEGTRIFMEGTAEHGGSNAYFDSMVGAKFSNLPAYMATAQSMNDEKQIQHLQQGLSEARQTWNDWLSQQFRYGGIDPAEQEKIRSSYNAMFDVYDNAAGKGYDHVVANKRMLENLSTLAGLHAWQYAPQYMRDKAVLGDAVMAQLTAGAVAGDQGTKNRIMINGHLMTALNYVAMTTDVVGGKTTTQEIKNPEVKVPVLEGVRTTIDAVVKIPAATRTPQDLKVFGNAIVNEAGEGSRAATLSNVNGALARTASPVVIETVHQLAKQDPEKAQAAGSAMMATNSKAIIANARDIPSSAADANALNAVGYTGQGNIDPYTRKPTPVSINFGISYNPETGRAQVDTTGLDDLSPTAPIPRIPDAITMRVNNINRALEAQVALQRYGSDREKTLNDRELKQSYINISGLPITAGMTAIPMPVDKKTTAPAPEAQADTNRVPGRLGTLTDQFSEELGLDQNISHALIMSESSGDPNVKVSETGNIGIAQLGEAAAKDMGVDRNSPSQNLFGGLKYFKTQLDNYGGDVEKAAIAYKAGPDNVEAYLANPNKFPKVQKGVRNFLKSLGLEPSSNMQLSVTD